MSDGLGLAGGVNSDGNIYPEMVPTADQWNLLFSGKVDALNGYLTNPSVLGYMTLAEAPSQDAHAASKAYVDGKISGSSIPDAPADGTPYVRQNNSWQPAPTQLAASVAGNLTIPGSLTVGQGATVTGDSTITGRLTIHGALTVDTNITSGGTGSFAGGITGTSIGQGGATNPGSFSSIIVSSASIYNLLPVLPSGYAGGIRLAADPTNTTNLFADAWAASTGYNGRRASGTVANPSGLSGNAVITALNAFGHDGSGYTAAPQAGYQIKSLNAWSAGDHGTVHQWFGTSSGAITQVPWLTLINGHLLIGGVTDGSFQLDVTGTARISSDLSVNGVLNVGGSTGFSTIAGSVIVGGDISANSFGATLTTSGKFTSLAASAMVNLNGGVAATLPAVKTGAAYTVAAADTSLILAPTATFTLTLPTAGGVNGGRILFLKLTAAFAVNSASANVVPLAGGAATAVIMPGTVGKFCRLQSDGTNWQIMSAN